MKILVVDDSRSARMIITKELTTGGYTVIEAVDGIEAIQAVQSHPDLKLVTMDVDMPRMDGYKACQEIKKMIKHASLPIVFLTANDTVEDRLKGFEIGATDFVNKPFKKGTLLPVIDKILKHDFLLEGTTTLVVEDSEVPRTIISNCLKELGVRVIQSHDGIEALAEIRNSKQHIDLIISDLEMPRMNGDELCYKVREELHLDIPIIFISSNPDKEKILELFKLGATDYIIKPFVKEELIARLRIQLQAQLYNRKLVTQVEELDRLNKLKDEFLAVCSHDLRTPLLGMLAYINFMLEDETNLGQDVHEFMMAMKSSSVYLIELINDTLNLNENEETRKQFFKHSLPLVDVLEKSINIAQYLAKPKNIHIELVDKSRYGTMSGNENALYRIFNNLLSNAIEASSINGEIMIRIEQPDQHEICVMIEDYGQGISEIQIHALFNQGDAQMMTEAPMTPERGVGLKITKNLVEKQQGRIEVFSEEGKGTRFSVIFPTNENVKINL